VAMLVRNLKILLREGVTKATTDIFCNRVGESHVSLDHVNLIIYGINFIKNRDVRSTLLSIFDDK
jgi:hypothetical protein